MFHDTQGAVLELLRNLPAEPGPGDEYGPPYNALKAYLISTAEYARSTRDFMSPVMMSHCAGLPDAGRAAPATGPGAVGFLW